MDDSVAIEMGMYLKLKFLINVHSELFFANYRYRVFTYEYYGM